LPAATFTGLESVACCQPSAVSSEKVTFASGFPRGDHSVPTCSPVLAADLKKRIALTHPVVDGLNCTPSSTLFVSGSAGFAGVDVLGQMLYEVGAGATSAAPELADNPTIPATMAIRTATAAANQRDRLLNGRMGTVT
jgi:hypothetical protein